MALKGIEKGKMQQLCSFSPLNHILTYTPFPATDRIILEGPLNGSYQMQKVGYISNNIPNNGNISMHLICVIFIAKYTTVDKESIKFPNCSKSLISGWSYINILVST